MGERRGNNTTPIPYNVICCKARRFLCVEEPFCANGINICRWLCEFRHPYRASLVPLQYHSVKVANQNGTLLQPGYGGTNPCPWFIHFCNRWSTLELGLIILRIGHIIISESGKPGIHILCKPPKGVITVPGSSTLTPIRTNALHWIDYLSLSCRYI
jgi:hypothetical protein